MLIKNSSFSRTLDLLIDLKPEFITRLELIDLCGCSKAQIIRHLAILERFGVVSVYGDIEPPKSNVYKVHYDSPLIMNYLELREQLRLGP